jgi:hypothetical protein
MFAVDMLRMKKKPGGVVTVSAIAPATEDDSGTLASNTFGAHTLTVTGAASVTYTWSFPTFDIGAWTINSGQGTAGAIPRVTSVADATTASATLRCTVVAGGVTYTRDCSLSYSRDTGGGTTMTL